MKQKHEDSINKDYLSSPCKEPHAQTAASSGPSALGKLPVPVQLTSCFPLLGQQRCRACHVDDVLNGRAEQMTLAQGIGSDWRWSICEVMQEYWTVLPTTSTNKGSRLPAPLPKLYVIVRVRDSIPKSGTGTPKARRINNVSTRLKFHMYLLPEILTRVGIGAILELR